MKTKFLKSLLIAIGLLVTSLTTQMWAADASSATLIYDNTSSNWSNVQFMIGHSTYSEVYAMTNISNTKLYYKTSFSWGGYTEFYFVTGCSSWGSEGNSPTHRTSWAGGYSAKMTTNVGSNKYKFVSSGSNNGSSVTATSISAYSSLNYTQTLNQTLSTDGGSTYSASTAAIATVKVSSYKLTSFTESSSNSGTISSGSSSTSCSAAQSATVTYTVSNVATGYTFVGWYDGSTQKSTNTTYTYNATGTKTITARFKENTYTVTVAKSPSAGGSVTPTSATSMPQITGGAITATPNSGYTFGGWSVTSGSGSFGSSTSTASNTFKPTAASTITATFNETMSTVSFVASPSGKGTFQVGGSTVTSTTAGVTTTRSVTAVPISGYRFSGWSITGGATISSTSANPTTVTGGGAGTAATLTATFVEDVTYYTLTYGVGNSPYNNGSVSAKNASTSAAISSGASVLSGTNVTFTATPTNSHYKLKGWYSDAACGSAIAGAGTTNPYTKAISATQSVYAGFELKTCTISLNKNGGSTGAASVTATHGSTLPSFTAHTRTGYTLKGYYTAESAGTKIIDASGALVASTSYANASKQWNNDATSLTLYAQWEEKMTTVTINASPTGAGTFTVGGSAFTEGETTTAGVTTSRTVVTTAQPGYKFSSWGVSGNATGTSSSTTYTLKGNGSAGTGTLTANFDRTYAYIQGRFQVRNSSARTSTTETYASNQDWNESSTKIQMDYDATNHRFVLHTYSTPKELSAQLKGIDPYFYIKTSTSNSSLAGVTSYMCTSFQTLTTAGSANGKTVATSGGSNANLKFNSSDESGWVILYFDQSKIWYELEDATYSCQLWYHSEQLFKDNTGTKVDMSYDNTEAAYYKDITTTSSPFYFRFFFDNSVEWSCDWNGGYPNGYEVVANGSKVTVNTDVTNWGDHSSCNYTGASGNSIRIWFDYTNKKTWITETTYSVTVNNGSHGTVTPNGAQTVGASGITITALPDEGYKFTSWSVTGGASVASSSATSTTLTATANGTVTANYTTTDPVRLYYKNTNGWSNVWAYVWYEGHDSETGGKNASWHGVNITNNKVVYNCETYYYYEFYMDSHPYWDRIIFNDGNSNQTGNISFSGSDANKYYTGSGWVADPTNPWALAISINWETHHPLTCTSATSGYVELDLAANTDYEFKFVENGSTWYGASSVTKITYANQATAQTMNSTSGSNQTIKTAAAGTYTFTWNISSKQVTVTYPSSYSITYDANGATGGTAPDMTYYTPGSDATLARNAGNLYKTGYAFKGWNTLANGSGTPYAPESTYSNIQSDVTLHAEWVANDKTMYYYNNNSWGTVKAHIWHYGTPEWSTKGAYPGVAMTNHQGLVYKTGYCSSVENKVTFNNGGSGGSNQTADLTIADGQSGNNWFYNDADKDVTTGGIHHGWSQYILAANYPTSTVAAVVGEKVTVVPTVVWADGINFADITITSTRASGSANINAVVSGTNIIVSGTEAGTATFNITYTYLTHTEATITKTLSVKVMNGLTIQAKVPSSDDHWVYSNIVKMHYWGGAGTDANPSFAGDVTMDWIKDVADGKYYQACVPVGTEATPETNFIFFYDNFDNAWRQTQNVEGVTENSCYIIKHDAGLDKQRNADQDGTGLCNDSWNIQITMGSGDIYTSNIVETSSEIVSFFAPSNGSESKSYRQGVVTIEHNGTSVVTVPANTFSASGVYTAKIDMTNPASPVLTNVALYTGDYYIRTDGAAGGWDNYKTNSANKMTEFTRNANFANETFSYYWVANVGHGTTQNIKATVANDYNPVLCNFTPDETANEADGINLRFGYEPTTNEIVRGIVGGSTTNNFLNLVCATGSQIYKEMDCVTLLDEAHYVSNPRDSKFADKSNWVYEIIVYAKIDDDHQLANVVLKSFYKGIHYLLGMEKDNLGHDTSTPVSFPVIKSGTTNGIYGLRVVYDFKTNRLFAAWAPADRVIDGVLDVDADVMFVRHEDEDAAQISFNTNESKITDLKQAILALELENEKADHGGTGNIERHYFLTLPFNCKVSNIFGIGGFMNYWGIQRYRGDLRAQKGWFIETPTFWEWLDADDELIAGEGYLLSVDKKALENDGVWKDGIIYQTQEYVVDGSGDPIPTADGLADSVVWVTHTDGSMLTMYFPSTTSGFDITPATGESLTLTYPDQPCSITREDRNIKDSNWKCIGTPGYKNVTITGYDQESPELVVNAAPRFLYEFHEQTTGATWATGTYTVVDGSAFTYKSFHSYLVQFAGTIDWAQYSKGDAVTPSPVAPRRMPNEMHKATKAEISLLSDDNESLDRTFVWLQEDATTGFDQNFDLNKMTQNNANQIYSFAEHNVPFAANVLPLETDTVQLVANIVNAGEFTFTLNKDKHVGMAPILYDMFKSEQVNLMTSDYTVELEKGKYEGRFFLLFQPEAPVVTNFETTEDGGQKVHSDEAIYDVLGRRVNTIYPGHLYIVNGEKCIAK